MWLALFIFALAIAAILTMLISLSKQGDERRSMIVGKASAAAFVGAVGYVVACVVENFVQVWGAKGYAEGMNPQGKRPVTGGVGKAMRRLPADHQCH